MSSSHPRPKLLSIGIVLTSVYVSCVLLLVGLGSVIGLGIGGLAMLENGGEDLLPLGILAGAFSLALVGLAIFYIVVLVACFKTWHGSRSWTIALIVFASLGLISAGPISVIINVLTIVGCVQALGEAKRAAPQHV